MFAFNLAKTVLKSLFTKPSTRMYPIAPQEYKPATRGNIGIEIETCIFCGICQKKCPTGAITVVKADKSWEIERFNCIACGYCVDSCPKKCLTMENPYTTPDTQKTVDTVKQAPVEPAAE